MLSIYLARVRGEEGRATAFSAFTLTSLEAQKLSLGSLKTCTKRIGVPKRQVVW